MIAWFHDLAIFVDFICFGGFFLSVTFVESRISKTEKNTLFEFPALTKSKQKHVKTEKVWNWKKFKMSKKMQKDDKNVENTNSDSLLSKLSVVSRGKTLVEIRNSVKFIKISCRLSCGSVSSRTMLKSGFKVTQITGYQSRLLGTTFSLRSVLWKDSFTKSSAASPQSRCWIW